MLQNHIMNECMLCTYIQVGAASLLYGKHGKKGVFTSLKRNNNIHFEMYWHESQAQSKMSSAITPKKPSPCLVFLTSWVFALMVSLCRTRQTKPEETNLLPYKAKKGFSSWAPSNEGKSHMWPRKAEVRIQHLLTADRLKLVLYSTAQNYALCLSSAA